MATYEKSGIAFLLNTNSYVKACSYIDTYSDEIQHFVEMIM